MKLTDLELKLALSDMTNAELKKELNSQKIQNTVLIGTLLFASTILLLLAF